MKLAAHGDAIQDYPTAGNSCWIGILVVCLTLVAVAVVFSAAFDNCPR